MMKNDWLQANDTAKSLVNNYPSHNYAINSDEAKNALKLTIKHLENLSVWPLIKIEVDKVSAKSYAIKYGEIELAEPKLKVKIK